MADLKTTLGSLYTPEIEKALEGSRSEEHTSELQSRI